MGILDPTCERTVPNTLGDSWTNHPHPYPPLLLPNTHPYPPIPTPTHPTNSLLTPTHPPTSLPLHYPSPHLPSPPLPFHPSPTPPFPTPPHSPIPLSHFSKEAFYILFTETTMFHLNFKPDGSVTYSRMIQGFMQKRRQRLFAVVWGTYT